jgi:hypothetical protein
MIVTTIARAMACDRRGPHVCAYCGEQLGLPCVFTTAKSPDRFVWLCGPCGIPQEAEGTGRETLREKIASGLGQGGQMGERGNVRPGGGADSRGIGP